MIMLQRIDNDSHLYVTKCGPGYTCKGFDYLERDGAAIYKWFIMEAPRGIMTCHSDEVTAAAALWTTSQPGTEARCRAYEALCAAGHAFSRATGRRCNANLTPQLIGLEGHKVQVRETDQESMLPNRRKDGTRSFIVGKSTGWFPIHLEIANRRSHGGGNAAMSYDGLRDLGMVR